MALVARGLGLFGDVLVANGLGRRASSAILHGDIDVECGALEVSGNASFRIASVGQYAGGQPGGRNGIIPSTSFIVAEYQRQEIERQLRRVLSGSISAEQIGADVSAYGRVKSVRLVASASVDSVCAADCSASAEFIDVELEMMAILLAA